MGACAPRPSRPPSALQLCQDFDSSRGDSGSRAQMSAGAAQDFDAILQHMASDEVRALGEIIGSWAQGSMDSHSARRHVQLRVLRGQTPLGDPFSSGLIGGSSMGPGMGPGGMGSGGRRSPGTAPADTGSGSATFIPGQADVRSSGSSRADRWETSGSASAAGAAAGGATDQPPPTAGSLFTDLALSLLGGGGVGPLHSSQMRGNSHEVFSTLDAVFFCRSFRDALGLALRELDLDGPRPLPEEVQESFRRKAHGILQDTVRRQTDGAVWLDLVRLCLFVEVVRHVSESLARSGVAPSRRMDPRMMMAPGVPLMPMRPSGSSAGRMMSPSVGQSMDVVFVINGSNGSVAALGFSGLQGGTANFRLDPDFLQGRVGVLLEALASATERRPRGLSPEEIDRNCPCESRTAAGDDDVCPVCLEPSVHGEAVRQMPCGHAFHKECCEAWLSTANTCPMCRFQVMQRDGGADFF